VLKVTEGNVVDHGAVIAEVVQLAKRYAVQEVAIDRWNSTSVNTALQAEGFMVAPFGQGFASMLRQ
jgi:phage terminase large subunit-like protein